MQFLGPLHPPLPGVRRRRIPAICWVYEEHAFAGTGEVHSIRRFRDRHTHLGHSIFDVRDDRRQAFHGYDFDISMQVKEAGKKTSPRTQGHSPPLLELISEMEGWVDTHMLSRKWQHLLSDNGGVAADWEERPAGAGPSFPRPA